MSNSYVAEYRDYIKRTRGQDDPRADWQLTLELGDMLRQSGEFDSIKEKYPDFRKEYLEFKADNGRGVVGEISSGFGRAARGLGATALGAAALGLDAVGADETARSMVQKGKALEQGGDNAPAVESMDDITGIGSAAKYAAGKLGEAAPSLLESVGTGMIGAAAGTAAEPGAGTAVGGVAGFFGKQAIKGLLKREVAKRILTEAGEELTEAGVRNALAKGLLKDALAAETRHIAKTYGTNAAIAANSYLLSSGEIYNATENPALALGAGAVSAIPDTILPAHILSKFRGGAESVGLTPQKFAHAYLKELSKTIPIEAGTEAFQEAVNIAAERYNDGEDPMPTAADFKRLREAAVGGAAGGFLGAPMAAYGETRQVDEAPTSSASAKPQATPQATQQAESTEGEAESTEGEDTRTPKQAMKDGARKAAMLVQSDPKAALARLAELDGEDIDAEEQGELALLKKWNESQEIPPPAPAADVAAPAPTQSPAAVAPAAPTSGGESPKSTWTQSKLSVDGTQPSAATPSAPPATPLVKPQSPEDKLAEVVRIKNRMPGRLEAIARRFPQASAAVAELLKAHPAVGNDEASVREYAAKVNAIEDGALRARVAQQTERQQVKAAKTWDKRETVATWQTLNATPNLDEAGQQHLAVMTAEVDRWKARKAELVAKDKLSLAEAEEARTIDKRLKRYALPQKLTPAPGNTNPAVVQDTAPNASQEISAGLGNQPWTPTNPEPTPTNGLQKETQGQELQVTAPASEQVAPAAAPMFGEVGSSKFYDDETYTQFTPELWVEALNKVEGRTSDGSGRSKTRVSIVLQGPNGEVIERGLIKQQRGKGVTAADGAVASSDVAVQGIARTIDGKKQVVLESKDGKRANPMLVADVVAAGWKPVARIVYTGEPGVISNNYANRAHFDASYAQAKKGPAAQTKGDIATHIAAKGDNAIAAADAKNAPGATAKVKGSSEVAIDSKLLADAEAKRVDLVARVEQAQAEADKLTDPVAKLNALEVVNDLKRTLDRFTAGIERAKVDFASSQRDAAGLTERSNGKARFNTSSATDMESERGGFDAASEKTRLKNLAAAAGDVKVQEEAAPSTVTSVTISDQLVRNVRGALSTREETSTTLAAGKVLARFPFLKDVFKEAELGSRKNVVVEVTITDSEFRVGAPLWEHGSRYVVAFDGKNAKGGYVGSESNPRPKTFRLTNTETTGKLPEGGAFAVLDVVGDKLRTLHVWVHGSPLNELLAKAEGKSISEVRKLILDELHTNPQFLKLQNETDGRATAAAERIVRQSVGGNAGVAKQSRAKRAKSGAGASRVGRAVPAEATQPTGDGSGAEREAAGRVHGTVPGAVPELIEALRFRTPKQAIQFYELVTTAAPDGLITDKVLRKLKPGLQRFIGDASARFGGDWETFTKAIQSAIVAAGNAEAFAETATSVLNAPPVTTAAGRVMPMGIRTGTDLLLYGADMPLPAAARNIITTLAESHSAILADVKVTLGQRESYDPATNTISVADNSTPERVLEEVVHAITVRKWRAAVAAYGPELTDAPAAFRDLAATYEMARAALGQQQPATPDQAFAAAGITGYRLASMEEFLAGVLTDREFQATLDATPIGKTTLWARVLNAIRNLLGLAPHTTSLLDAALRATGKFAEADPISEHIAEKRTYLGTPTEVVRAFTATEHIPAEYLDPITGKMHSPHVLPDSPAAAAWNLLFAPPADERSTWTEATAKNDVAANRDYATTLQSVWKALAKNGESIEQFLKVIGGKALPTKTIESIIARVPTARDAKLGSLDQHEDRATRNAYDFQRRAQYAANKAAIRYEQEAEKSGDALVEKVKKAAEVEKRFRDAEYMEAHLRTKLQDLVRELAAGIQRGPAASFAAGRLAGAIRAIEGLSQDEVIPEQYQQVFKQVLDGSVSVFDYLQAMAKMPVDFKAGPRAIAQAIEENAATSPALAALAKNKPMKAALATLAATNSKEMNLLALRVLRDQAEYLATMADMEQIRSASAGQLEQIAKTIPAYGEARSLRDRIKAEHVAQRREMAAMQKRVLAAEANAERARKAGAMFGARAKELEKIVGAFSDWQPVHGATYFAMTRQKDGTWVSVKRKLEMIGETHSAQVAKDIATNQRWLVQTQDELGGTRHWNEVKRQTEAIHMADVLRKSQASHRFWLDRFIQPISEKFEGTGTISGRQVARRLRQFQFIVKTHGDRTEALAHRWDHAMQAAAKAAGYDHHLTFFKEVYDHVLYAIESEPGIANDEARVMRLASRIAREYAGDRKMANDFPQKLAAVLRETKAISEHFLAISEKHGLHVEDAKLTDPLGAKHNLLRHAIRYGWLTAPRKLRASTLQNTVNRMTGLGWKGNRGAHTFEITDEEGETRTMSMDEAQALFTPDVIDLFVTPFATKPGAPIFEGAIGAVNAGDKTVKERQLIDQDIVASIWRESQGVADFAERLFYATGGTEYGDTLEDFSANLLGTFDKMFHMTTATAAMTSAAKNIHDPQGPRPHRIMDSRTNDLLPPEFFEYETFDPATARAFLGELAYHAAFGRDAKGLDADLAGMQEDLKIQAQSAKLLKEDYSKRERAAAAKRLGIDLRAAERAQRTLADVQAWAGQMHLHFSTGKQSGALGDSKALLEAINLNMMLVLNQPKSGLWNLMSLADFPLLFRGLGKTSRSAVAGSLKYLLKGMVGSSLETFGIHMLHATENEQILGEMVDGRSTAQLPWSVALSDMGKHAEFDEGGAGNTVAKFSRKVQGAMKKTVKLGGPGEFGSGADALWSPFRYLNNLAAHSLAVSNVKQVEAMIARAMKFYEANPDAFNNPTHRLTAADLGMAGKGFFGDEGAYDFYRNRLSDYGLGSIETLAREAMGRRGSGARVLSREQVQMVGLMALNEISMESSVNTRPIEMFNNPVLNVGMKLLGWPIAKMNQVHKALKTDEGQIEARALMQTLAVMALWSLPVGIAASLAMDDYDEEITGKKSNLRSIDPLAAVPILGPLAFVGEGGWSNLLAALERGARAGNVYGMGADFANSLTNVLDPKSGQRDFSLDSRVLVMSQFANFRDMVRNLIQQDGTATYASVGRPFLSSLGGNGAIQYLQIWNNLTGADNAEARVTAKISAQNWLRAAGREIGLELRGGEGRSSPTPLSVQVREMQLAAYAGDRIGFLEAYRAAVEAARREAPANAKPGEAEARVLASWRGRNPLTSTFRGKPTEMQVFQLLNAMDDSGRAAVQGALSSYDQFTEMIAPVKMPGMAMPRAPQMPKAPK